MRTQEEFESERYFGLQKFDNPQDAFKVMEGVWGEENDGDSRDLHILTDDTFEKAILERALEIYFDYVSGEKTKEEYKRAIELGKNGKTHSELLDFDFFLYSQKSRYYTSRMSFKDDLVFMWNDRQWEYFEELRESYSFEKIISKAIRLAQEALGCKRSIDTDTANALLNMICNENGLFY